VNDQIQTGLFGVGVSVPCVLRLLIVELGLLRKHVGIFLGIVSKSCFWNEVNQLNAKYDL
jgi:hypothetical protein